MENREGLGDKRGENICTKGHGVENGSNPVTS